MEVDLDALNLKNVPKHAQFSLLKNGFMAVCLTEFLKLVGKCLMEPCLKANVVLRDAMDMANVILILVSVYLVMIEETENVFLIWNIAEMGYQLKVTANLIICLALSEQLEVLKSPKAIFTVNMI